MRKKDETLRKDSSANVIKAATTMSLVSVLLAVILYSTHFSSFERSTSSTERSAQLDYKKEENESEKVEKGRLGKKRSEKGEEGGWEVKYGAI